MARLLYTYRMSYDTGNAPCVYLLHGLVKTPLLSLACCKGGGVRSGKPVRGGLRREIGDALHKPGGQNTEIWLAALYRGKLLYAAQVTDVIPMRDYFTRDEFAGRMDRIYTVRSDADPAADYNYLARRPRFNPKFHPAGKGNDDQRLRDELGRWVLLSDRFLYLGEQAAQGPAPDEEVLRLFPRNRGRKRVDLDQADGASFMAFLTGPLGWSAQASYAADAPSEPLRSTSGCQR